tara:strand:+ start:1060 stop:1176 length:117 start_codon:yes stop_codon:yes gene_type:complete
MKVKELKEAIKGLDDEVELTIKEVRSYMIEPLIKKEDE